MKTPRRLRRANGKLLLSCLAATVLLGILLLSHLGSLTKGLSAGEVLAATTPVGWHGIYHQALYLPLSALRSVVFFLAPSHGQLLTRLPNALFGALSIVMFGILMKLWHGNRTAFFATLLFACSAWVLHVSRLASFDVLYLWGVITLLLSHALLQRFSERQSVIYGCLVVWGLLLYIPGFLWLLAWNVYLQRVTIRESWQSLESWVRRAGAILLGLVWLPLLIINLLRPGQLRLWLGLPAHFATPAPFVKQFGGVFVHLFIRGPQYPTVWLAKAPILDVFSLVMAAIGIYFYATHLQATRSRLLVGLFVIGFVLVGLGGAVGLSILVPLLYIAIAAGLSYFLLQWLQVFPHNPLARSIGIGLLSLAVAFSCVYNLKAYFVAWPHNEVTKTTFRYHR